jgi:predicted histidine transporter YuiF (NhaC family)
MTSPSTGAVIAASGRWHLGIGDPDAISWCIVGAYAVAVGLSVWAIVTAVRGARQLDGVDPQESRNQRLLAAVWLVVAVVMLLLGINKQLDLQTWFLQTMRRKAFEGGWYGERRRYQADFIGVTLLVATMAAAVLAYVLRRVLRRIVVTIVGLAMLVLFVTIRAISFHYVDYVLRMGGRLGVNVTLELAGILLIAASALVWLRGDRRYLQRAEARAVDGADTARLATRATSVDPAPIP